MGKKHFSQGRPERESRGHRREDSLATESFSEEFFQPFQLLLLKEAGEVREYVKVGGWGPFSQPSAVRPWGAGQGLECLATSEPEVQAGRNVQGPCGQVSSELTRDQKAVFWLCHLQKWWSKDL